MAMHLIPLGFQIGVTTATEKTWGAVIADRRIVRLPNRHGQILYGSRPISG
jgi:hypothetical protein